MQTIQATRSTLGDGNSDVHSNDHVDDDSVDHSRMDRDSSVLVLETTMDGECIITGGKQENR